ncbi:MAG: YihY family inner membrane protein [Moraxellaceae bacterium]|nr:MAG: YihY family inner membrane protein [Moraxellaceae bacterium]
MKSFVLADHPNLVKFRHFILMAYNLFMEKGCQKSAASLTYMTLFAIVPLLTVSYSMFSITPAFNKIGDQFQSILFSRLLPSNEDILITYLSDFSQQARNLTAVGVIFLMGSAYFMLKNIEQNFNAIWNVARERRGLSNFLLYWAVLSLGPLLLGLALAMNTYLISLRIFVGNYGGFNIVELVFSLLPWLLTAAAFTLLFIAVPNCKVLFKDALLGGVLTMLAFELFKKCFSLLVANSSFNLIYGAFAIVPLFLLWINISWMVILGGAVFVRTLSLYRVGLKDRGYPDFFGTLLVLWQFHLASFKGETLRNSRLLHLGLSADQWQRIYDILLRNNIISATQQNGFVLSRDLAHLTLSEVKRLLHIPSRLPVNQAELHDIPWMESARSMLGHIDVLEEESLNITVEAFFERRAAVGKNISS